MWSPKKISDNSWTREKGILKRASFRNYRKRECIWWATLLSWQRNRSMRPSLLEAESPILSSPLTFSRINWQSLGTWDMLAVFFSIDPQLWLDKSALINSLKRLADLIAPEWSFRSDESVLITLPPKLVDLEASLLLLCLISRVQYRSMLIVQRHIIRNIFGSVSKWFDFSHDSTWATVHV